MNNDNLMCAATETKSRRGEKWRSNAARAAFPSDLLTFKSTVHEEPLWHVRVISLAEIANEWRDVHLSLAALRHTRHILSEPMSIIVLLMLPEQPRFQM